MRPRPDTTVIRFCILYFFYCIVKYCIVLSRHILVYFFVFYFSVFSAYVANKRLHISPICPEAHSGWICTKFGLVSSLADIINCAEFCCSRLRGFDSVGGQNSPSRVNLAVRR